MKTLRDEMAELFAVFLPSEAASRFQKLLALEPRRWEKIDPWRAWRHVDSRSVVEWKGSVEELLASSPVSNYASAQVTVLRCGHDAPSLERLPLRQALVGDSAVYEGFISVVPGRVGVAINHDGELCVLSKGSNKPLHPIARKTRSD
jgi:hypothetical protein